MSIGAVITGGYGAFSTASLVITDGFSLGLLVVPNAPGLEYYSPSNRMHYKAQDNLAHYAAKVNRHHYEAPDEDL